VFGRVTQIQKKNGYIRSQPRTPLDLPSVITKDTPLKSQRTATHRRSEQPGEVRPPFTHPPSMAFQPLAKQQHGLVEEDLALPVPRSVDSDLCCMEDGWDKDSPSKGAAAIGAAAAALPRVARPAGARLPTPSERAQLRRARPAGATAPSARAAAAAASRSFHQEPFPPLPNRVDLRQQLEKMFLAQLKGLPKGVTGEEGGKALCHGMSPFVAERRALFVEWEVRCVLRMLSLFLSIQAKRMLCCCTWGV